MNNIALSNASSMTLDLETVCKVSCFTRCKGQEIWCNDQVFLGSPCIACSLSKE